MTVTKEERAELRRLLQEATPGQWHARFVMKYGAGQMWAVYKTDTSTCQVLRTSSSLRGNIDAQLVAKMKNTIERLLNDLDAMEAANGG